ncbi:synaptonemal complex protein 2-like isoform X2 [Acipenser ruthenus]|uniref:synaptonemal complex protein 2-like isoform X2 n=1 Tax=Acipenser ruthenus TaxID=7906 RepID=UPI00274260AF|nr:synaptonemal complex protein 2-like isoform X2 [Acipenser ruthenus]
MVNELDKNDFRNVALLLKGIQCFCMNEFKSALSLFIQQGLVLKLVMWFERATDFLKCEELKSNKALLLLIEEFYNAALELCKNDNEAKSQIQDTFLQRLGYMVVDTGILFVLRLEAIRTINSILDTASKEDRKKIKLSEEHSMILLDFARLVLEAGDYEMQVAISEALCRLTLKKSREELVYRWFENEDFANSFKAINDREFETDCRKFLNQVNESLGDDRRVYTFPCKQAFLEARELSMPKDENLEKFWIDFNLGSSSISFFINDPEGVLWDSINIAKEAVSVYRLEETDEQNILTVYLAKPISGSNKEGSMVKIYFDSLYDIQMIVKKLFGEEKHMKSACISLLAQKTPGANADIKDLRSADFIPLAGDEYTSQSSHVSQGEHPDSIVEDTPVEKEELHLEAKKTLTDAFELDTPSESELIKAKQKLHGYPGPSDRSLTAQLKTDEKQKSTLHTKTTSWRTKKGLFSESEASTCQSERSLILDLPHRISLKKDYTRRKPKIKSRLKVLPLSSSSGEEEQSRKSRHSIPKLYPEVRKEKVKIVPETTRETELEDTVFLDDFMEISPEKVPLPMNGDLGNELRKRKHGSLATEPSNRSQNAVREATKEQQSCTPPAKKQFISTEKKQSIGEEHTETGLSEDSDSGTEGANFSAAFECFSKDLQNKFWPRYKRMVVRAQHIMGGSNESVLSLLNNVHNCRLKKLERFQSVVVGELMNLEKDNKALMEVENNIMDFCKEITSFCETQEKRLQSLDVLNESTLAKGTQTFAEEETLASSEKKLQAINTQ